LANHQQWAGQGGAQFKDAACEKQAEEEQTFGEGRSARDRQYLLILRCLCRISVNASGFTAAPKNR
jgi:hypothetical protein